ncbi:MAG: UvrD/REP helicase [Candidatus Uhrbacteria bacterium GW2011_GWD1_41_16]|uniref:DNA 3'-5' helicase n=1 Tax=Candidatus Uhrbacteria bacterium GW2011_GWC1_41_20 TaxID=1618983 RepID=A0A0G0VEW4_9BACT|nr:MAG: UvrD/REP helicase [Candidatus Uhrbacteria bacterium GW2011_GWD1_41_16]KKR98186.1 MAG: UvrD/REP helicase [Candidatus Uhrbacteria bacterium GW2011_GWC1_41_20]KKS16684.1 MAG: UvrD/REP helicase [Candidatus Uhrbacteria bacterium GW2011_GWB1_41_7]HAL50447.1 ATP-dependent DNA helicase [Candidatus Uhrbacteria bacterium]HAN06562.1 ATP-dependent DNA helicase [Candidatus Uhrbacteria bacterium]
MTEFVLSSKTAKDLKIDYQNDLNDQQFNVVQKGDGPVLVLAGAGSGKTRTITYRVAWLLEHGVSPDHILLLTFTNKASREMIGRVNQLLGDSSSGIWAGTFHSVANRILRMYARKLGFEPNFSILDQEDSRDLISLCLKELAIDTKNRRFPSPSILQELFSYSRNKGLEVSEVVELRHARFLHLVRDIEEVGQAYERLKKAQNSMDFDDLLLKLLNLLEQNEDVRLCLATQFQYVLVDEFQDTNVIQARIVQWLSNAHRNLFVVGDDAQSIYSFRAADIQNILSFPDTHAGAQVFHLTKNYRSTPEILAIANEVIANNTKQFEKELQAIVPSGDLPCYIPAQSQPQEAHYVADVICRLLSQNEDPSQIAVLFRAAFHSQALEFELMRRDISYEYRGGMKFFERAHIKDAIAYLRLIHNPKDISAWMRALRIHAGIGLVTAQKIAQTASGLERISDVFLLTPPKGARAQQGWTSCLNLLDAIDKSVKTPADFIKTLASSSIYKDYLEHEYPNAAERLDDLEQLVTFASQYVDLQTFLDDISLTQEYGQQDDDAFLPRIVLSTVHQAKGLEWNHVFVINLSEGAFPHKNCSSEEEIEEERRLFYVAVTRARKRLHLSYPMTGGRGYEYQAPSLFIDEISSHRLERVELRSNERFESRPLRNRSSFRNIDDEPMIVLDNDGEVINRPSPSSFLRGIDEL